MPATSHSNVPTSPANQCSHQPGAVAGSRLQRAAGNPRQTRWHQGEQIIAYLFILLGIFLVFFLSQKAIVWDEPLFGSVILIAKKIWLKERNVLKTFTLQTCNQLPDMDVKHVIFIARAQLPLMDAVANVVLADDKRVREANAKRNRGVATGTKEYHIYFVPRASKLCEKHLQDRGVFGSFATVAALAWEIYPVDSDLLSMELPNVYK